MDMVGIREKLVTRMHTLWAHTDVPVFYDNVNFPDPAMMSGPYIEFSILFDGASQANISHDPFIRRYGTLEVCVYVKAQSGTKQLLSYLDELSNLFGLKDLGGVHTREPRVGWEREHAGWYSTDLRVSFYADSNA